LHCVIAPPPVPLHTSQRVIETFFLHFTQYLSSVTLAPFWVMRIEEQPTLVGGAYRTY